MDRQLELKAALLVLLLKKKKILLELSTSKAPKQKSYKRTINVRPCFLHRSTQGFYHTAVKEFIIADECHFKDFLRMTPAQFNNLVALTAPLLVKNNGAHHGAISVEERLCISLRFLASGDSVTSISFLFRVGKSTASGIISECMEAIWECLSPVVFPALDDETFSRVAEEFERKWHMPNCIGAIDGKHVLIQAPPKSGSNFYNYKKTFSIVLLAVADASAKFLYCDIGAFGKQSDGGVLKASSLGMLIAKGFKDPIPRKYGDREFPFPYFLVGDAAFPRGRHIARPYSLRGTLSTSQKVFNLRISHARQCVERSFGILVQRFQIFRKPIQLKVEKVESVVKAAVCLHNWLPCEAIEFPEDDNLQFTEGLSDVIGGSSNTPMLGGADLANLLSDFFMNEGAQSFQWK